METPEIIARLRQVEAELRARGLRHAALIGSRARGDNRLDSDIDIIVEFAPEAHVTVFDYAGVKNYSPVDVIDRDALKPHLRAPAAQMPFMLSDRQRSLLRDILHQIDLAERIEGQDLQSFGHNEPHLYAVTRCLEDYFRGLPPPAGRLEDTPSRH